jgi:hypothetical protein
MRRSWLVLVLLGPLFSAACGPGQVAITAEIDVPDPDVEGAIMTRPIADLEVQLIPFDRDSVFDSLTAAFPTPEPPIPADLLAAQEEIAAAQAEWSAAEATWGNGRARLQELLDEMEPLNRAEARYAVLFREYQDVETQVARAERVKDEAFRRFTDLQEGYLQRRDSMKIIRDQWADDAFAASFDVFAMKLRETGQEILADTTDAQGLAVLDVPPGDWWVYAFYDEAYSELYWNIHVTVVRGDPAPVRLTRETAEIRPIL